MKICLSTCPPAEADRLAEALVQERVAACVNVLGPIRSRFWWDGAMQSDQESLLIAKTSDDKVETLIARLQELHPYDMPEILAIPVETGLAGYLAWVDAETLARSG